MKDKRVLGTAVACLLLINAVVLFLIVHRQNEARRQRQQTPLHDCVSKGTEVIAIMLLKRGADVTIRNKAGLTPLQLAKVRNRPEMEELLRKHGARE
ncbi:MAG TPA: ankyrin repeat domain-containing protein [Verrucomicrobiae bacterium]|jgi:ankyrin repeat protein